MITVDCNGCSKQLTKNGNERIYEQRHHGKVEYYCVECNRYYYDFLAFIDEVYSKFDEEKKAIIAKGKAKIFGGQKKQEEAPKTKAERQSNLDVKVKADLDKLLTRGTTQPTDGEIE